MVRNPIMLGRSLPQGRVALYLTGTRPFDRATVASRPIRVTIAPPKRRMSSNAKPVFDAEAPIARNL